MVDGKREEEGLTLSLEVFTLVLPPGQQSLESSQLLLLLADLGIGLVQNVARLLQLHGEGLLFLTHQSQLILQLSVLLLVLLRLKCRLLRL